MNINNLTDGQKTFLLESLTESKKRGSITNAELLILEKLQMYFDWAKDGMKLHFID